MHWGPTIVRFHTFLTGRESTGTKPVTGLTAAILLEVAQIGYTAQGVPSSSIAASPSPVGKIVVNAPGQAGRRERIAWAILHDEGLHRAAIAESGGGYDWVREERKLRERRTSDSVRADTANPKSASRSVDDVDDARAQQRLGRMDRREDGVNDEEDGVKRREKSRL